MEWHCVANIEDIVVGRPKIVTVAGKEIGIFYEGDRYYAVLNVCPHRKAEVCKGRVSGTVFSSSVNEYQVRNDVLVLRCPWHRWEFELNTGRAVIPSVKQRLKTYQVRIENGNIFVAV